MEGFFPEEQIQLKVAPGGRVTTQAWGRALPGAPGQEKGLKLTHPQAVCPVPLTVHRGTGALHPEAPSTASWCPEPRGNRGLRCTPPGSTLRLGVGGECWFAHGGISSLPGLLCDVACSGVPTSLPHSRVSFATQTPSCLSHCSSPFAEATSSCAQGRSGQTTALHPPTDPALFLNTQQVAGHVPSSRKDSPVPSPIAPNPA